MDYFIDDLEGKQSSSRLILQSWASLKESFLPKLLHANGYQLLNYGLCDFKNANVTTTHYFADYEERVLFEETIYGRIKRDIWWKVLNYLPGSFSSYTEEERLVEKNAYLLRDKQNFDSILSSLKTTTANPRFIFGHLMLPHAPFYYDRSGNQFPDTLQRSYYDKYYFTEQLQYTNGLISQLINAASPPSNRPRVIIIAGDHGFRIPGSGQSRKSNFENLAGFYSSRDRLEVHSTISPVNYFRVVLNNYFGTKLPQLSDSTILLQ
ncbi:MAG: sulfatase-like hydrolase/transferase [Chitinophagaceae bacterium]|nr:sulfatase-like hydrolase/transferase [Chitinophagaceae bacterium]